MIRAILKLLKREKKAYIINFEHIKLKRNGSCIDIFDYEDNLLIRIAPHYVMKKDITKIEPCQNEEIKQIVLNFEYYYHLLK